MQISTTPHPGRLLLEKALLSDPSRIHGGAHQCLEELKRFTDLVGWYLRGYATFNEDRNNYEETGDKKEGSFYPYQTENHKIKCLRYQVSLFVAGMKLEDKEATEFVAAYLFNKIAHPQEKLSTLPLEEDRVWKTLEYDQTIERGWGRFRRFLVKIGEGTWKTTEQKVQLQFEEYRRCYAEFEEKVEQRREKFSSICKAIINDIERRGNTWLNEPRTTDARKSLYKYIKQIQDFIPSAVDQSVRHFLASTELQAKIPQTLCDLIRNLQATFDDYEEKRDKRSLKSRSKEIKNQTNPDWENGKEWIEFIDRKNGDFQEPMTGMEKAVAKVKAFWNWLWTILSNLFNSH